jgi:hypothetical protein
MPKRLGKDDRPRDIEAARHLMRRTAGQPDTAVPAKKPAKVQSISRGTRAESLPTKSAAPAKITQSEISRVMAAMGSKGGKASAKSRMVKIAPQERSRIALNAARARWAKPGKKKKRG